VVFNASTVTKTALEPESEYDSLSVELAFAMLLRNVRGVVRITGAECDYSRTTKLHFERHNPALSGAENWVDDRTKQALLDAGALLNAEDWTDDQVKQALAELFQTLAALHAAGIAHRDLSSNNLVQHRTERRLLITDLGSARFVSMGGDNGVNYGHLNTQTPEQCDTYGKLGCNAFTPSYLKQDVWALTTAVLIKTRRVPPPSAAEYKTLDAIENFWANVEHTPLLELCLEKIMVVDWRKRPTAAEVCELLGVEPHPNPFLASPMHPHAVAITEQIAMCYDQDPSPDTITSRPLISHLLHQRVPLTVIMGVLDLIVTGYGEVNNNWETCLDWLCQRAGSD